MGNLDVFVPNNKNMGPGVGSEKKYTIHDVDIHLVDDETLKDRIKYLNDNKDANNRVDLQALATYILTGYPF